MNHSQLTKANLWLESTWGWETLNFHQEKTYPALVWGDFWCSLLKDWSLTQFCRKNYILQVFYKIGFLFVSWVGLLQSIVVVIHLILRKYKKKQFASSFWSIYPCELLPNDDLKKLWIALIIFSYLCDNCGLLWSRVCK